MHAPVLLPREGWSLTDLKPFYYSCWKVVSWKVFKFPFGYSLLKDLEILQENTCSSNYCLNWLRDIGLTDPGSLDKFEEECNDLTFPKTM